MQSGHYVAATSSVINEQDTASNSYGQESAGPLQGLTNDLLGNSSAPQHDRLDNKATAQLSTTEVPIALGDAATAGDSVPMMKEMQQQEGTPGRGMAPPLAAAPSDVQPTLPTQQHGQASTEAGEPPVLELIKQPPSSVEEPQQQHQHHHQQQQQQQQQQRVPLPSHLANLDDLRLELSRMQLNAGARIIAATREVRRVHLAAGMREVALLQQLQAARKEATQQLQELHTQVQRLLQASSKQSAAPAPAPAPAAAAADPPSSASGDAQANSKQSAAAAAHASHDITPGVAPAHETTAATSALEVLQGNIRVALQLAFTREAAAALQLQEAQQRQRQKAAESEAALRSASPASVARGDPAPAAAAAGATN